MNKNGSSRHEDAAEFPLLLSPWIVSYLGWPLAGFASLAAYVLTEEGGLAVAAIAAGSIWPDLVAAIWNGVNDRNWRRRIGIPLCHLAAGLNYSVVLALFLLLGAGFASVLVPRLSLFRTGRGEVIVLTILLWAGAAALMSIFAVAWCLATKLSAWVDSRPLEQILDGRWPPRQLTTNEATVPVYVTLITVIPIPFVVGRWFEDVSPWLATLGWLGTLLLIGLSWKFFFALKDRVVASTPMECWPEMFETEEAGSD